MKKSVFAGALFLGLLLAACSTTAPTAEVIVVTATAEPVAPTAVPPTAVPPPTAEPTPDDGLPAQFLTIISPGNGSSWESTDFVQVTGSARGMPSDDVIVIFIDQGRNIHGFACAELGAPNADGISTYSTRLTAPVSSATEGKIISGVLADDGSVAGSAGVFATANPDSNSRHVTIEEPGNRCVIPNPAAFTVTGSAQGLQENSVTVQALDASGNVLQEQTVSFTPSGSDGSGTWAVQMSVSASGGTEGQLRAFSGDINSRNYTVFYGE